MNTTDYLEGRYMPIWYTYSKLNNCTCLSDTYNNNNNNNNNNNGLYDIAGKAGLIQ